MYDRLAQKVHSSTLVYCLYCKVPYSKGSGSHMPVAPDPPSEPQGGYSACDAWRSYRGEYIMRSTVSMMSSRQEAVEICLSKSRGSGHT